MESGNIIIISAPSGTGKTTILKRVMGEIQHVSFSVSHTTRPPRPGEKDGIDYFFTDRKTFAAMRQQDLFLEWAEVHGNLYGTSSSSVRTAIGNGMDIVLDIDVQGARQVMDKLGPQHISVFIAPPSRDELARRLAARSTETDAAMAERLANAVEEMKSLEQYDYIIVNDTLNKAVEVLKSIIVAERSRKRRDLSGKPLRLSLV